MMTRDEFEARQEEAAEHELEQLSRLSTRELIDRIRQGNFGIYDRAFAALAAKKDVRLAGPVLLEQLTRPLFFGPRLSCAYALLNLLPYSGIPVYALADRSHPGHGIYMADLDEHLQKTLAQLSPA